tara:strand:- start:382 stop:588 length:207 start_codon:yes stop_codon:yes gene_type:complete
METKLENESMNSWIMELLSRDSLALREYLREITPDIDLSFTFVSEATGETSTMDIPLNVEFFWPAGRG